MKTKITKAIIFFFIFLMFVMPGISLAQTTSQGLIPCGRSPGPGVSEATTHPCEFKDIMTLINTVIHFVLFYMVIPIAAIMFAYAGFLMVISGGSTESRTKAKHIFTNTVLGLVFAAAAWLIIRTILAILGYDGTWIFDKF